MGLGFSFLDWWSLFVSMVAWVKEMNPEVYKESSITSSSMSSGRTELLSNCRRLSELEIREDCDAFLRFVFFLSF